MKKIILLVLLLVLGLIVIHRIYPVSPLVSWLFIDNQPQLEIELIGSGLLAFLIGLSLVSFEDNIRKAQNKERSERFFKKIIKPAMKNAFLRSRSTLNTNNAFNMKAYFDNSNINNLYDVIDKYLDQLNEFQDYHQNDNLVKTLVDFYSDVGKGYIEGERLDILLVKMAKICRLDQIRDKNRIIFLKGLRYAKFDEKELNIMLEFDPDAGIKDFVNTFFKNPESDTKLGYKKKFDKLDSNMKQLVLKLQEECNNIKKLLVN